VIISYSEIPLAVLVDVFLFSVDFTTLNILAICLIMLTAGVLSYIKNKERLDAKEVVKRIIEGKA
jgi:hypothetical protein